MRLGHRRCRHRHAGGAPDGAAGPLRRRGAPPVRRAQHHAVRASLAGPGRRPGPVGGRASVAGVNVLGGQPAKTPVPAPAPAAVGAAKGGPSKAGVPTGPGRPHVLRRTGRCPARALGGRGAARRRPAPYGDLVRGFEGRDKLDRAQLAALAAAEAARGARRGVRSCNSKRTYCVHEPCIQRVRREEWRALRLARAGFPARVLDKRLRASVGPGDAPKHSPRLMY